MKAIKVDFPVPGYTWHYNTWTRYHIFCQAVFHNNQKVRLAILLKVLCNLFKDCLPGHFFTKVKDSLPRLIITMMTHRKVHMPLGI